MTRRTAAALFLAIAACADRPPTIVDGSSPDAFARTAAEARRDLPDADRIIFDKAINSVGGRRFAARDANALARVTFDGMTAAEIVADQKLRDR
ncbi:MAG TPA: hypothetical protein VFK50_03780 [Sphingomicrobium sp.]|nr:hypothetical protein [Sphingomicrobium sp.]